ncbi:hypothetical protein J1605_003429 [Eschrichtius robustus]|uniref:Adipogenesis regulatory factor n=1 Tax=Eschrichtius robustus TaxID=9764 RepID=A0AB34HRD5_ESCRO|nr:hypothetical protein J1605_003429 [Eschrichtius robustus]
MAGAGGGGCPAGGNDLQWCFSQVKGAVDEDVAEDVEAKAQRTGDLVSRVAKPALEAGPAGSRAHACCAASVTVCGQ